MYNVQTLVAYIQHTEHYYQSNESINFQNQQITISARFSYIIQFASPRIIFASQTVRLYFVLPFEPSLVSPTVNLALETNLFLAASFQYNI